MSIYSAAVTLLLVLDPFGNIPIFLSVLNSCDPKRRKLIIVREMFIALFLLSVFLFFGQYILTAMHISGPALSISGGIVLFLISIKMIFPDKPDHTEQDSDKEPVIVPLAVPLVAGPSSLATVILLSKQDESKMFIWFLALLSAWAVSFFILYFSSFIQKIIGDRVLTAIERLMGMILTTMSVQMLLSGLKDFINNL